LVERELPKLEVTGSRPVRRFSAVGRIRLSGGTLALYIDIIRPRPSQDIEHGWQMAMSHISELTA
jgi:hypothetical protein